MSTVVRVAWFQSWVRSNTPKFLMNSREYSSDLEGNIGSAEHPVRITAAPTDAVKARDSSCLYLMCLSIS